MYKTYKLVTLLLNTKGGESQTIDGLYKEVDGVLVPCTKEESILKFYDKLSKVGGNPATQSIKVMLLDTDGNPIKIDELVKPSEEVIEE